MVEFLGSFCLHFVMSAVSTWCYKHCWCRWYVYFYIRCPQLGEGIYLLLCVLAELPVDLSGLRQLLCQVRSDVIWQLLVRGGQRRH